MSNTLFLVTSFALLSLVASGCAAANDSDATSSEDLASTAPIGHYLLATDNPTSFLWLNEINLHHDGTFDGNFGSDVSNLSGHFFLANGTYKVAQTSRGRALSLTYSLDGSPSGTQSYVFKTTAHGIDLRAEGDSAWFSMDSAAAPVTIHFYADGSVHADGALHVGDTALVRYAAGRAKCSGKNQNLGVFAAIDSPQPQFVDSPVAVNGFYDFMVPVSAGKNLSVWFESTNSSGCVVWDSNASRNFVFPIEAR